jgi:hypothetical protein
MRHFITQSEAFTNPDRMHPVPPATMAWLWSRTSKLKEVWGVVQAVGAWPGVAIAPDCSGVCLVLRGVVLGHIRWNGRIDLPFGPEVGDRLVAEEMASRDPDQAGTNQVVFDVRTVADVDRAVWLLRLAYLSIEPTVKICATGVARPPVHADEHRFEIAERASRL